MNEKETPENQCEQIVNRDRERLWRGKNKNKKKTQRQFHRGEKNAQILFFMFM